MTTSRYSRLAFVGVLSVLSATTASAMSCAIDANGKTTCPTSQQVEEFNRTAQPVACTMDAKQCPDGSYVGRVAPDCEFAACPGTPSCAPYVCVDGTTHPSCSEDGHVINYFAEPCLTHGGDAGPFTDVPANHANAQAIAYLKDKGVVEGYANGTFKPDSTINRAEFVKILAAANYSDADLRDCRKQTEISLLNKDVAGYEWFADYLCAVRIRNLVIGYPDGTFRPDVDINFVEAAKIIMNTELNEKFTQAEWNQWLDVESDPWYQKYASYMAGWKAIPMSIASLDQRITRGEMAEMMWRIGANIRDLPARTYDDLAGNGFVIHTASNYFPVVKQFGVPAGWEVDFPVTVGQYELDGGETALVVFQSGRGSSSLEGINHLRIAQMNACPDISDRPMSSDVGTVTINGTVWAYASGTEGAAGSIQEYTVYTHQVGDGTCVVMTTNTFHSTGEAYDEPMRSQVKKENAEMNALLLRMAQSVVLQ